MKVGISEGECYPVFSYSRDLYGEITIRDVPVDVLERWDTALLAYNAFQKELMDYYYHNDEESQDGSARESLDLR